MDLTETSEPMLELHHEAGGSMVEMSLCSCSVAEEGLGLGVSGVPGRGTSSKLATPTTASDLLCLTMVLMGSAVGAELTGSGPSSM